MNNEFRVNSDLLLTNDGLPEWVTVFKNNVPQWEKLIEDDNGMYVLNQNNEKVYVFEA